MSVMSMVHTLGNLVVQLNSKKDVYTATLAIRQESAFISTFVFLKAKRELKKLINESEELKWQ